MQKQTNTITEGSLYSQLIALTIPLVIGNILQQLYNLSDALVIARFAGTAEFSAVGVAGTVMNFFLFAIVGACNGFSVLFSQRYGAQDFSGFRRVHFCTMVTGLSLTILLSCICGLFLNGILRMMCTPTELMELAFTYLMWILLSLPAAFFYNFYAAILRAIGNTRAAMLILAASITVNLMLDLLLVGFFQWGVRGAAMATAVTQVFSAFVCFFALFRSHRELFAGKGDCRLDRDILSLSLRFGSVTALHQSGLYLGKMAVQAAINACGTAMIAAFTAASRIEGFANSFGDSNASATAILVGQNYGAKKRDRVELAFRSSRKLMACFGLLCSVLLAATAQTTVGWILDRQDTVAFQNAVSYLQTIALFYVFCFTGNSLVGYFNGIGKVSVPFLGSAFHILLRVILAWLTIRRYHLKAIAVATGIGWILINLFWSIYRRLRPLPDSEA